MRVLVAAIMVALVAVACGDSDEEQAEAAISEALGEDAEVNVESDDEGFTVEVEDDGGSFTVRGEDESVEFDLDSDEGGGITGGTDVEVPDDLPIALAEGGTVLTVFDTPEGASIGISHPIDEYDAVVEHYRAEVESLGEISEFTTDVDGNRSVSLVLAEDTLTSVTIVEAADTDEVFVNITVATS